MQEKALSTQLMQYIHLSRYARWLDDENRRETWEETVSRYTNFFAARFPELYPADRINKSIGALRTMPSMRALMTAGPALDRDEMAGNNCAYIAVDHVRAFDEILYVLMCFHPDTPVVTRTGTKRIADITVGDEVQSIDETTGRAVWKRVTNQIKTKSAHQPKVAVALENGHTVKCTSDHKWLTTNRGWVEAGNLTTEDDLAAPGWEIYRITNTLNGKAYIGQTSKTVDARFREHVYTAFNTQSDWHFAKALRKYPLTAWKVEVIDFAFSQAEAFEKEQSLIEQFDTLTNGYNSTNGGEGAAGYKWTPEQRQRASDNAYVRTDAHRENQRQVLTAAQAKIVQTRQTDDYRAAQRERNLGEKNPMFGKTHPPERIAQISQQMSGESNPFYGRQHTEETKQKIRDAKPDATGAANPFFGKKHSEETRAKMKATKAAKKAARLTAEELA